MKHSHDAFIVCGLVAVACCTLLSCKDLEGEDVKMKRIPLPASLRNNLVSATEIRVAHSDVLLDRGFCSQLIDILSYEKFDELMASDGTALVFVNQGEDVIIIVCQDYWIYKGKYYCYTDHRKAEKLYTRLLKKTKG